MQSKRHSRRKKAHRTDARKNNNIIVFKLIDPICQSLLFILFIYCLDSDTDISYQDILWIVIAWQLLSCIVNFFINHPDSLKKQRIAFLLTMLLYMCVFFFVEKTTHEKFIVITAANNSTIPLHESILDVGALIISFWYYIICFREIREMLTSVTNEAS